MLAAMLLDFSSGLGLFRSFEVRARMRRTDARVLG